MSSNSNKYLTDRDGYYVLNFSRPHNKAEEDIIYGILQVETIDGRTSCKTIRCFSNLKLLNSILRDRLGCNIYVRVDDESPFNIVPFDRYKDQVLVYIDWYVIVMPISTLTANGWKDLDMAGDLIKPPPDEKIWYDFIYIKKK